MLEHRELSKTLIPPHISSYVFEVMRKDRNKVGRERKKGETIKCIVREDKCAQL